MSTASRATRLVAAATAVCSLVSPGVWGAWQDSGSRAGGLHSAEFGYSLTGTRVTGGGTGYSWTVPLGVLSSATDHFSVTNTGSVTETIRANVAVSGINLGSPVAIYGCPNIFSGTTCTGRVTLGSVAAGTTATVTLAPSLAAGATYNLAVSVSTVLGVTVTTSMAANTFAITPPLASNRTSG